MKYIPDSPKQGDDLWFSWALAVSSAHVRASKTGRRHQVRYSRRMWLVQEIR